MERADDRAGIRHLERAGEARHDRHDLRLRHRKVDLADVEEWVAECVDAVAFDVRHRAGGRHVEVAVEEHRTDRIARREARFRIAAGRLRAGARSGGNGDEAHLIEIRAEARHRLRGEARHRERNRDRPRARPGAQRLRVERGRDLVEDPFRLVVRQRFQELGAADARRRGRDLARRQLPAARRDLQHLVDRRDAADRLLGELPAVGERADHFAVDVDRRAAHAGDDPRAVRHRIGDARDDHVLIGSDVRHHPDDLDVEPLQLVPFEDRDAVAFHPLVDLGERHDRVGGGEHGSAAQHQ